MITCLRCKIMIDSRTTPYICAKKMIFFALTSSLIIRILTQNEVFLEKKEKNLRN
jgi:hypothetical protein